MCGRYTLVAPDPAQLRARFGLDASPKLRPRYNIAPGDQILTVTGEGSQGRRAETLRWGLVPAFAREPGPSGSLINARAESVAQKPAFRTGFARHRCLIIADGFYEWARLGDAPKRAFHITRADHAPFAFAGISAVWRPGTPQEIRSAAIITTAANAAVAAVHDRMPVILAPEAEADWLDPATPEPVLQDLLQGLSAEVTVLRPVGTPVNSARNDGPECLADPAPADAPAQVALF